MKVGPCKCFIHLANQLWTTGACHDHKIKQLFCCDEHTSYYNLRLKVPVIKDSHIKRPNVYWLTWVMSILFNYEDVQTAKNPYADTYSF